ncbi:MAG TPA: cyclic nucleotide-binding domain-containing protein [Gemmatimonadales bacterium]|nr:cyclic nucleotide-binding domain-containing protein [Gemmatimonadales bacterium]
MSRGAVGRLYHDGEVIIRQGEAADGLFVVLDGQLEILSEHDGKETRIRIAGAGELIGEMAVFERQVRSATVRALGEARLLTVDRKNFLRRINEDPSLAFRMVETMSRRIRELSEEIVRLKAALGGRGTE